MQIQEVGYQNIFLHAVKYGIYMSGNSWFFTCLCGKVGSGGAFMLIVAL